MARDWWNEDGTIGWAVTADSRLVETQLVLLRDGRSSYALTVWSPFHDEPPVPMYLRSRRAARRLMADMVAGAGFGPNLHPSAWRRYDHDSHDDTPADLQWIDDEGDQ